MKNIARKTISVLLSLLMVLTVFSGLAFAQENPAEIPERDGYTFKTWVLGEEPYDPSVPLEEGDTLTPLWVEGTKTVEAFDNSGNRLPDGWTQTSAKWNITTSLSKDHGVIYARSGGRMLCHDWQDYSTSYAVMPAVDLSAQSVAVLSFWYVNANYSTYSPAGNFGVAYRVNGGAWSDPLFTSSSGHSDWTKASLLIPAEAMKAQVEFGFFNTDSNFYLGIEDVTLSVGRHDVTYSAAGNTLTATCANEGCAFDGVLALTLNAPEKTVYGDGKSPLATLAGTGAFRMHLDQEISADGITYERVTEGGTTPLTQAPENAGSYIAKLTVTVGGTPYTIEQAYTIAKAEPDFEIGILTATAGDTLASVILPAGFRWEADPATPVGDAGEKTFRATYTPEDAENYNTVTGIDVVVTVKAAAPETPDTPDTPPAPDTPDAPDAPAAPETTVQGGCPLCGEDHTGHNAIKAIHYVMWWLIWAFRDWMPGFLK